MSTLSGYSAELPDDVMLDTGVLFVGNTAIGVSRGGLKFDPKKTVEGIPFDGQRTPIMLLDRTKDFAPEITGKFLQFGGNQIPLYELDVTSASASGVITYTPKEAGVLYSAGAYLETVRLIFERGLGGYAAVLFDAALCTKYNLTSKDKSEVEIDCTFEARLNMALEGRKVGDPPFVIELRDALPS